jgi:hypothetical protein
MITQKEIDEIMKSLPKSVNAEVWKDTCSALTGLRDGKNAKETSAYYNISLDFVNECWNKYNLMSNIKKEVGKRSAKTSNIKKFLNENVGKTITPKDVVEATNISMPTFYNFYNANRSYFKKVKRGQFQILDPASERERAK